MYMMDWQEKPTMEGDQTKAEVYVKYLDQDLKITQVMQYKLTLEKGITGRSWRQSDEKDRKLYHEIFHIGKYAGGKCRLLNGDLRH